MIKNEKQTLSIAKGIPLDVSPTRRWWRRERRESLILYVLIIWYVKQAIFWRIEHGARDPVDREIGTYDQF